MAIIIKPTRKSLLRKYAALGIRPKPDRNPAEYDLMREIKLPTEQRPEATRPAKAPKKPLTGKTWWGPADDMALLKILKSKRGLVHSGEVGAAIGRTGQAVRDHMRVLGYADRITPVGNRKPKRVLPVKARTFEMGAK